MHHWWTQFVLGLVGCHAAASPWLGFLPVQERRMEQPASLNQDQAAQDSSDNSQDPDDDRQRRQVTISRQVLLNASPEVNGAIRVVAAQELLVIELPEAATTLAEALRSGQPVIISAVIEAMRDHATLRPDLLDPMIDGLAVANESLRNQIGLELARHDDAAVERLIAIVDGSSQPLVARLNAVYTLGSIRNRASAAALMTVLNPERTESQEVIQQTCESLTRLTGFDYGNVPTRWQEWWRLARNLSSEGWSQALLNALTDRIATLEQQMQAEREARRHVVERLIETYRELFATISRDDEQLRIEPLLADPLPGVRLFAVSRIERMLRDGVRIDEPLQQRIPTMLSDAEPEIRQRAALVLQQLAHPDLVPTVAAALTGEASQTVAIEFLHILANHPRVEMLDAVLPRIAQPGTTDIAADTVWNLLSSPTNVRQHVAGEHREAIRGAINALGENLRSAAVMRVYANVCTPNELQALLPILDADDATLKRAVAEGIALGGPDTAQPLVDRAADPVVYPFAVDAVADGPATVESIRRLADLRPPNGMAAHWGAALNRSFARLPPDQIIAADDLLSGIAPATPALRADALNAAMPRLSADDVQQHRLAVTERLASILLAINDPARAHAVLEGLNGIASTPELQQMRFRAAAMAGQFDRAAEIDATPASWVALVATLSSNGADTNAPLARQINDEIRRRFDGELSDEQRASLDQAISMLPPIDDGASGGASGDESARNATASAGGGEGES